MKRILKLEEGSIAPLGIGFLVINLALLLAVFSAGSLFLFQKRLTTLAEATALYVAQTGNSSMNYLERVGVGKFQGLKLNDRTLIDGLTVEVVACALWRTPLGLEANFVSKEVCSHASARSQ